jgi:hypothetical protein
VVPSEDEKVLRVFDFVSQEQTNGFKRLLPSVNVIAIIVMETNILYDEQVRVKLERAGQRER